MVYANKANNRTIQCIGLIFFYHVHIIKIHLCKEYNFQYILYYIYIYVYVYKYILYITITIIKKAAIVFSVATLMRTHLA